MGTVYNGVETLYMHQMNINGSWLSVDWFYTESVAESLKNGKEGIRIRVLAILYKEGRRIKQAYGRTKSEALNLLNNNKKRAK